MTTAGLLGILSKKIYIIPTLVLLAHTHTTQRPNIRQPQPQFLSNLGATRLKDALFDYKDTFIIFVLNALGLFFCRGFSVLSLWGSLDSKNVFYPLRKPNANLNQQIL